jgi:anthranilate synthase component 1
MRYRPSYEEFVELARGASVVPVYRQLIGDTLTPVSAFCKIQEGDWAFLFESVVGGERLGRYSFLGSGPFLRFQAHGRRVSITGPASPPVELEHSDPLRLLEERLAAYRAPHLPGLPRFCGGAVGYAGYDSVRYVERLPNPPDDDRGLPDLCFAFYDRMVIFDHINKTVAAVAHAHVPSPPALWHGLPTVPQEPTEGLHTPGGSETFGPTPWHGQETVPQRAGDLRRAYDAACQRVDRLVERLQQGVADLQLTDVAPVGEITLPYVSNFEPDAFEAAVARCKEYIKAGDIFQVVLSQRLQTETKARAFDIYRTLRVVNPSPFLFYLRSGPLCLVGSSPEIMARVEGDTLTIRPLAGTRPRGPTPEEDDRLAVELSADPKERAEHIMLVDLGRNDVGRVAVYGSVRLSDVMTVERYSHVMHLCSTVTGRLQPGRTAFDALRSCLPAGTLSGAPKVRAMEIIDELEPHRRGPYGGAVGYIDFSGNMDTCIALRTLVLKGQTAYLQAGAGIVADSDPASEREETLNKARGLLRALEMAEKQL